MIIDSHQHFWQLDLPFDYGWLAAPEHAAIHRDFLPEHLKPQIQAAGVNRTVFVQTQHNLEETRWALGLADRHDFLAGVVGWVDLAGDAGEDQLLEFQAHPKFVGIRHLTHDEPDDDFIVRPDVLRGLKTLEKHGVPFELLFYIKHIKHAARLAREFPELPLVIDHLAKPRIKDGAMDDWKTHFQKAAECPNVYCKLSGMITEADWRNWRPSDLKPYVEFALEAFGPDRLMYGSDWPVCELAGSYADVFFALKEVLGSLGESESQAIYAGTAARCYGLS